MRQGYLIWERRKENAGRDDGGAIMRGGVALRDSGRVERKTGADVIEDRHCKKYCLTLPSPLNASYNRGGKTGREANVNGSNDGAEARGGREMIRGSTGFERGTDECGKKWRVDGVVTEGRGVELDGVADRHCEKYFCLRVWRKGWEFERLVCGRWRLCWWW